MFFLIFILYRKKAPSYQSTKNSSQPKTTTKSVAKNSKQSPSNKNKWIQSHNTNFDKSYQNHIFINKPYTNSKIPINSTTPTIIKIKKLYLTSIKIVDIKMESTSIRSAIKLVMYHKVHQWKISGYILISIRIRIYHLWKGWKVVVLTPTSIST